MMRLCADGGIVTTKKKKQKGTVWNISEEKLKPFVWNVGPAVRHATDDGRVRGASKVEQTADEPESLIEKERQKTSPNKPIDIREVCITKEGKEPSQ